MALAMPQTRDHLEPLRAGGKCQLGTPGKRRDRSQGHYPLGWQDLGDSVGMTMDDPYFINLPFH